MTALGLPMLVDREVDVISAIIASIGAVARTPGPWLTWAVIVAGLLLVGMIPGFLGLLIVLPVLGHATWHLYRRASGG